MSLDITNYKIPGVYVDSTIGYSPTGATNESGVKIALIGQAIGHTSRTETHTFVKGVSSIELDNPAIDDSAFLVGKFGAYQNNVDYTVDGKTVTKVLNEVGKIGVNEKIETTVLDLQASLTKSFQNIEAIPQGQYIVSAIATANALEYAVEIDAPSGNVRLADSVTEDSLEVILSLSLTKAQAVSLNDTPVPLYVVKGDRQFTAKQIEPKKSGDLFLSGVTLFAADGETKFAEGVDFVVSGKRSAWTIARVPSSTALAANATVFAVFEETSIGADETVIATYNYAPEEYNLPQTFTNAHDLSTYYGVATSEGSVTSQLSLAGQLAFAHGASQIVCVPVLSNSTGDFTRAIALLESVLNLDIVIPLSGSTTVHDAAFDHCVRMSAQGEERRAFIGLDGASSPYTSAQMQSSAKYWSDMSDQEAQRVLFVSPSSFSVASPSGTGTIKVAGFFLAAGIAGVVSRNGTSTPITNKRLSNAVILHEIKSKLDVQAETAAGLCVVANKNGASIVHGRTASNASVEEQELSVVMSHDHIVRTVRSALSAGIVGRPLTDTLIAMVSSTVENSMSALRDAGYCRSYAIDSIKQISQPSSINVGIKYRPVYGLNYINVTIAVDPTVG